jgi:hypothetical protein
MLANAVITMTGAKHLQHARVVVDDENASVHATPLS